MPNWVYNVIEMRSSDGEELVQFLKQHIVDGIFDFNTIIPEPKTEEDCPREYNFNKSRGRFSCNADILENPPERKWFNWYDWRIEYWGTKWNSGGKQYFDYDKILKDEGYRSVRIHFQTAWSAPKPVFKKLLEMHKDLGDLAIDIIYYSTENGECGGLYLCDGDINHYRWKFTDYYDEILK